MSETLVAYLLGPAGAAGLTLVLILTGVLVPKPYHKKVLDELEKVKEANDILIKSNSQLQDVNRSLSNSGQLTNQVITTMMEIAYQKGMVGTPQSPAPSSGGQNAPEKA